MKLYLQIILLVFVTFKTYGQLGVKTDNPNATLDVQATNATSPNPDDGILIPRVDTFPAVNPTALQDGLLLFITGNATPSKGFYYWDQNTTSWIALTNVNDADWYEEGTTNIPTDITDDIYRMGNLGIGKNIANYPLDIETNYFSNRLLSLVNQPAGGAATGIYINPGNYGGPQLGTHIFLNHQNPTQKTGLELEMISFGNTSEHLGLDITIDQNIGASTSYGLRTIANMNAGDTYGVRSELTSVVGGSKTGMHNILATPSGNVKGTYNHITGNSGYAYGTENFITGTFSEQYGAFNTFNSGNQSISLEIYGVNNAFETYGSNVHKYGVYNLFESPSTALQNKGYNYGLYNEFSGSSESVYQMGVSNIWDLWSNGNLIGMYNEWIGAGSGVSGNHNIIGVWNKSDNLAVSGAANSHYGVRNELSSSGLVYGVFNEIYGLSSFPTYGTYNVVHSGTGGGYGSYNIAGSFTGPSYAVYAENLANDGDDFAGYFLGGVSIGTTTANNYLFPASRGTNGQVIQTDGSGNLNWVNPGTLGYWNRSGNVISPSTAGDDIRFYNDQSSIIYPASTGTPAPMIYMFSGGAINSDKMVLAHSLTSPTWGMAYNDVDDAFFFRNNGTNRLEIDLSGNNVLTVSGITESESLGIGLNNPGQDISIKQSGSTEASSGGLGLVSSFSADYWKVYHSGSHLSFSENGVRRAYVEAATGNYIVTSDQRLKKDITPLHSVLEKVLNLKTYTYQYIDQDTTQQPIVGLLAQEVQTIFPEAVSINEDGYLGINYDLFGVLAIKSIQEQQKEIESLNERLNRLEKLLEQK